MGLTVSSELTHFLHKPSWKLLRKEWLQIYLLIEPFLNESEIEFGPEVFYLTKTIKDFVAKTTLRVT